MTDVDGQDCPSYFCAFKNIIGKYYSPVDRKIIATVYKITI